MEAIILKLACPDRVGLLARITSFVAGHGGNLLEVHQFTDPLARWFFARLSIAPGTLRIGLAEFEEDFNRVAAELEAVATIRAAAEKVRAVLFVSRLGHCLADLLWRWRAGELPVEIPLVISNHEVFRGLVEQEGITFLHVPVPPENRDAAFAEITAACTAVRAELLVLARYMQILPGDFCAAWPGRVINIHHSFLPAFIGADPYRRAFERGVKLIGATCHYVTAQLDEGPIIEQEVERVEHYHTPEDLLRLGRDCERLALARGVRYHVTDRVLIHGSKTVVFRD